MKKSLLIALVFLCQHAYSQCLLKEVPLQQRTSHSDLIVEGKVVSQTSFWNEERTMIYTSNVIEITKVFKGNIFSDSIEILTKGGRVGLKMIRLDPNLSLKEGETGIFMLNSVKRSKFLPGATTRMRYEAYASVQGFIEYDMEQRIARDAFQTYSNINTLYKSISAAHYKEIKPLKFPESTPRTQKIMSITDFSPATITAGTGSVLTITGSGFGASRGTGSVGFRDSDDGGISFINPLPSEYISWTDTEIRVMVPSGAGSGTIQVNQGGTFQSATPLTVTYSHLNVQLDWGGLKAYQTDHINANGSGGYTWRMNTDFDANTAAKNSFLRAFDTWRCGTNVNWIIGATTSVNTAIPDGINVICFDDDDPLDAGVLGTCASYWAGCTPDGIEVVWFVEELDIIFDEGSNMAPATWQFGPASPTAMQYDFETVAVHELGHGHQLGHVIAPGAIMHYAISNGTLNRNLSGNDISGGSFVQAKSEVVNSCGFGPMVAYTACNTLPISVIDFKAISNGNSIQLEWTNASESGVDYYELEESGNGTSFSIAANVAPVYNNGSAANYKWIDQNVYNGSNYYRLKSKGIDGEIKYSDIVKVTMVNHKSVFNIYPNPVKGRQVTLEINNLEKGNYSLQLYNSTGQMLMSRSVVHEGASATKTIDFPAVAKGWYAIRLIGGDQVIEQRIMVE